MTPLVTAPSCESSRSDDVNLDLLFALAALLLIAACGSSSSSSSSPAQRSSNAAVDSATTTSSAAQPPAVNELAAAEHPSAGQFPPARGRSLPQLGALVKSAVSFGAATGTFTPGPQRLAFGLNASSGAFVYAPTAVYIAKSASAPARGPFLASADPMSVESQYRSRQNSGPGGIEAIYATQVPVPHAGTYTVLSITRTPKGLIGAPGQLCTSRVCGPVTDVTASSKERSGGPSWPRR